MSSTMNQGEKESDFDVKEYIEDYKGLLRRKYKKIIDREMKARKKEGLFLYAGEWKTVEEINEQQIHELKHERTIFLDLIIFLALLVIAFLILSFIIYRVV